MAEYRFNSPPGWPVPPPGWRPPEGWQPDPTWPAAPPGWEFWVPEPVVAPSPPAPVPAPVVPEGRGGGLFGGKKKLEAENAQLREWVERLGGMEAMQISAMTQARAMIETCGSAGKGCTFPDHPILVSR